MQDMQREGQRKFVERRKRNDWVSNAITIVSIVSWILAISALLFLETARPQGTDMFIATSNTILRSAWNTGLLRLVLALLILVFLTCLAGFCFNLLRHKRKSDRYRKSVIILGILSIVGIVVFLAIFRNLL